MTEGSRIALTLRSPEDVIPHLGKPYHRKEGRSAKAVADSWFSTNEIPQSVGSVLAQIPWFENSKLVDAFLERKTDLRDGCGFASQTDLLAVVTADRDRELAIVAVEAKVDESFGPLVSEWLDDSPNKEKRLAALCELLRLSREDALPLRYQLLHRAAAAIFEVERYRQSVAALIVQSFCPQNTGFADFERFAIALRFKGAAVDAMTNGIGFRGKTLLLGWVADMLPSRGAA